MPSGRMLRTLGPKTGTNPTSLTTSRLSTSSSVRKGDAGATIATWSPGRNMRGVRYIVLNIHATAHETRNVTMMLVAKLIKVERRDAPVAWDVVCAQGRCLVFDVIHSHRMTKLMGGNDRLHIIIDQSTLDQLDVNHLRAIRVLTVAQDPRFLFDVFGVPLLDPVSVSRRSMKHYDPLLEVVHRDNRRIRRDVRIEVHHVPGHVTSQRTTPHGDGVNDVRTFSVGKLTVNVHVDIDDSCLRDDLPDVLGGWCACR